MEIILMICLIVVIGLLIFMILSQLKQKRKLDSLQTLTSTQEILLKEFQTQKETHIGNNERLDEKIKQVNLILSHIEKESTIDSQKIQDMFQDVKNINNIMINKKTRGNWGEYQLNNLLGVYVGDNQNIFEAQYSLANGYIGDVALHLPGESKVLIIDSKFPLENYQNLLQENLSDLEINKYMSLFKQNIKKHINDISKKYITQETIENAVMFIPSEAIYTYVCSECSELIDYAHSKHILMTSPTTLIGVVFTLINITKDFNRSKNIKKLEKEIVGMYEDAMRLTTRLKTAHDILNRYDGAMKEVNISTEKIVKRIEKIHDGYEPEE